MRAPPPFEITLRDAPAWRVGQALLWALAGAGLGAWLGAGRSAGWSDDLGAGLVGPFMGLATGLTSGLMAVLAGGAGWWLGRPVRVQLRWTGQRFELLEPGGWRPGSLRVMVDLGPGMLLRLRPAGGLARWVGCSSRGLDEAGHLLRAALYCAPCVDPGRSDEDRARS